MKVLLVEDDNVMSSYIERSLGRNGWEVTVAENGQVGLELVRKGDFNVVVTDVMMPVMDGLTMIGEIRELELEVPIIVLSAKNDVDDRVCGLKSGADDYLVKPFAMAELEARIESLSHRRSTIATDGNVLESYGVKLDRQSYKCIREGRSIILSKLEFTLLEYLMKNSGKVVTKSSVITEVWNYSFDPETNIVEACICKLRDKVDKSFSERLIHTVRGFGYVFEKRE